MEVGFDASKLLTKAKITVLFGSPSMVPLNYEGHMSSTLKVSSHQARADAGLMPASFAVRTPDIVQYPVAAPFRPEREEIPLRVREAAQFLGVSPQTVYLWVERKQIPHLRVMGRNIRFLKSELEPFRAQFKQEVENGQTEQA